MDWSWLSNLFTGAATAASAGAQFYDTKVNKQIADQNSAFQQQQFEYQKELNQQTQQREDTAYQRAAADMSAAGLSPLNVNPASAATLSSAPAPQNNYQSQVGNAVNQSMDTLTQLFNLSIAKKQADAQQQKTDSETALNLQRLKQLDSENPITREILNAQLQGLLADNISKSNQNSIWESIIKPSLETDYGIKRSQALSTRARSIRDWNDVNYMREYGLVDNMTSAERIAAFKSRLKNGRNFMPYDYLLPEMEYDEKTNSYNYGYSKLRKNQDENYFLPEVLDKDLLQLWMSLTGSILPIANLGK